MKILHLSLNDKFINAGYRIFEDVYPEQNDVWLYEAPSLKSTFRAAFPFRSIHFYNIINPRFLQKLLFYDLVVIHALTPHWVALINNAPKDVKFLWLGWGYDYSEYLFADESEMYLPLTRDLYRKYSKRAGVLSLLKKIPKVFAGATKKSQAIDRIDAFNPVLESEYHRIKNRQLINHLPPYVSWNYGTLEDTLIKGFEGQRIKGNNILLGNSADLKNNHLDAFAILKKVAKNDNQKIICPLSYAGGQEISDIIETGKLQFGQKFTPLEGFLPMDEYLETLKSCGNVVMNHIRQQGLGTIVQMLYLGARVFVREENPCYTFFKDNGAFVHTIAELQENPDLLNHRLTEPEIQININVLERYWSRSVIHEKTRSMVNFVLKQ